MMATVIYPEETADFLPAQITKRSVADLTMRHCRPRALFIRTQSTIVRKTASKKRRGAGLSNAPCPPGGLFYPTKFYYFPQDGAKEAECSRSDDGGRTFGPG